MEVKIKTFGGVGYMDQKYMIELIRGNHWNAVNSNEFAFGEINEGEGGIIWIGGNHPNLDEIQKQIDKMPWVLLFALSDEENKFRYEDLKHDNMEIWLQFLHDMKDKRVKKIIGCFPDNDCVRELSNIYVDKDLTWSFVGQCNHIQRIECVRELEKNKDNSFLVVTKLFNEGIVNKKDYFTYMARSKIIPCPSGIQTADSFRFFEALESGCLPVPDRRCFKDNKNFNYWVELFKEENLPFPMVDNWSEFKSILDKFKDYITWMKASNRCFAFWQNYKRNIAYELNDTINRLSGVTPKAKTLRDELTILISTSNIPSHPSTKIIEDTIKNLRSYRELKDVEIIIMIDDLRPELKHRTYEYEKYIQRLLWLCNVKWKNILPVITKEWLHQANTTKYCLDFIKTKNILYVEHDCSLTGDIPFNEINEILKYDTVNYIRLHYSTEIHEQHKYLMRESKTINSVPLLKTIQWSQRPHFSTVSFYKKILEYFSESSRTMIEDLIYGVVINNENKDFGLWIYHPEKNIQRSLSCDGRKSDSKFEMKFK